jgi:glycosyltransferase involved in cell wall biosynthesis
VKVAILTTDARDHFRSYEKTVPFFGTAPEALFQGFESLPEIEIHIVSCTRVEMCSPAKLAPNIFFHSVVVPRLGWLRTGYQGCVRAVRKKLREIQPDIVHGQGTEKDCAMEAVFSGFPNVVTIHGNMAELARVFKARPGSYNWFAARLETFALRRTGGVFCHSSYTEALVKPRARRTWRVANPLRQEFFAPLPAAGDRPCRMLNVGLITPRKRQIEILELARALHAEGNQFEISFIGEADRTTPYGARFFELIGHGERTGYARYLGTKTTGELIQCFDQSSGLIHFPSEEAFGLVVVEALARNLKFFGAKLGGIIDIASGVDGAELLDENDWAGLTDAIRKWLRTGFPRSQTAAKLMLDRYHPVTIAKQHVAIYREILGIQA